MDLIERQIGFIDKQLAEAGSLQEIIISRAPILFCALGLIFGIGLQQYLNFPAWVWFSVVLLSCIGGVAAVICTNSKRRVYLIAYAACIGFAGMGALRMVDFYSLADNDIAHLVGEEKTLATVRGALCTNVRRSDNDDWKFGRFAFSGVSSNFYMHVKEILTEEGWAKATGTIRVQVVGRLSGIKPANTVEIYCQLDRFSPAKNPGQFDVAKYLRNRQVYVGASVRSVSAVKVIEKGGASLLVRVRTYLQTAMSERLLGDGFSDERGSALVAALVLGQRGKIDGKTYEAFRKTNLAHFISLSGMHMGMLVGFLWFLTHLMQLPRRWRAIICIVLIFVYLLVIPTRAPSLRAAIIAGVFLLAIVLRKRPNILNSLSLAALLLLLWRPCDLFNAGWQLSFTAVLAILCLQGRIENWLLFKSADKIKAKFESGQRNAFMAFLARFGKGAVQLFSVGVAAWIGTCGILLYHFGTIALLSSVWTVLVFPLVLGVVMGGFLQMLLSLVLPTLAVVVGIAVGAIASALIESVQFIASIDNLQLTAGRISAGLALCYYVALLLGRFWYCKNRILKQTVMVLLCTTIVLSLAITKYDPIKRRSLRITCLDVGHGQAIVAQLPGGRNIMFDAGSLMKNDCGRRVVNPFLRAEGIAKLDAIFLSHDDIDHINGVPEIVAGTKVSSVFVNSAFMNATQGAGSASLLEECLTDYGLDLEVADDKIIASNFPEITLIWPSDDVCRNTSISDNDKAMVVLIEHAGRKILLCSDIERYAQEEILRLNPDLKADVVVMPHHGSTSNLSDEFVERLGGRIIVVSCSRTRQAAAYKAKRTVKSFYTPIDGAITITIDADSTVSVKTFASENN